MTLEETRTEIVRVKRRRRRTTGICLVAAAASVAACVWACSVIMPLYGRWQYEHRRENHELVTIAEPSYIVTTIVYEHDPPSDIYLEDFATGHRLRDLGITDDPVSRTMTITCDVGPGDIPGSYFVSLVPADNDELKYAVETHPSYKYVQGDILFTRDADGNLWIKVGASYSRCTDERGLRVLVHLTGPSYAPSAYDGFIAQPADGDPVPIEINLSETVLWRKYDMSKVTGVEVTVTGEYVAPDGEEVKTVNYKKTMPMREWPLYEESQDEFAFDMTDTNRYLYALHLRPPEGRDPISDPDAPPEEPGTEPGTDPGTEEEGNAQETN